MFSVMQGLRMNTGTCTDNPTIQIRRVDLIAFYFLLVTHRRRRKSLDLKPARNPWQMKGRFVANNKLIKGFKKFLERKKSEVTFSCTFYRTNKSLH